MNVMQKSRIGYLSIMLFLSTYSPLSKRMPALLVLQTEQTNPSQLTMLLDNKQFTSPSNKKGANAQPITLVTVQREIALSESTLSINHRMIAPEMPAPQIQPNLILPRKDSTEARRSATTIGPVRSISFRYSEFIFYMLRVFLNLSFISYTSIPSYSNKGPSYYSAGQGFASRGYSSFISTSLLRVEGLSESLSRSSSKKESKGF